MLMLVAALISCEQEEFISGRIHHFVLSLGIADLDETGVTVEFEVRKTGTASIEEYGVEYTLTQNLIYGKDAPYDKVFQSEAPASALASIRISYDLLADREYTARPYVKSGGTMVYGENLVFSSQGVHAPVITEVNPTEFYLNSPIRVKGDYFNSKLENNSIELVSGAEDYRVYLDSVDRTSIKFRIGLVRPIKTTESQSLSLRLTSGGKSVLFPVEITSIVPSVVQMSPKTAYVGDKMLVEFNYPIQSSDYSIELNGGLQYGYRLWFHRQADPNTAEVIVSDAPAGEYFPSFANYWFPQEYKDRRVEVLSSWESFQRGLDIPNLGRVGVSAVGDRLLIHGWDESGGQKLQSLELGASHPKEVPLPTASDFSRVNQVKAVEGGRYVYYGLGLKVLSGNAQLFHDFYRLDMQTNRWERLADFPFDYSSVIDSFFLEGKLYVVLWNYLNFRVYDPQTDTWEMSPVQVPQALRSSGSKVVVQDYVYFALSGSHLTVNRYSLGGQVEIFAQSQDSFFYGGDLIFWDGHLVVMNNGSPNARLNMATREFTLLQKVHESGFSRLFPWPTSQGLMMAFPIDRNSGFQTNDIYRLIQDF